MVMVTPPAVDSPRPQAAPRVLALRTGRPQGRKDGGARKHHATPKLYKYTYVQQLPRLEGDHATGGNLGGSPRLGIPAQARPLGPHGKGPQAPEDHGLPLV